MSEANGKRMPVDADPVVGGNLIIIPNPVPSARVVDPTPDMFDDSDTGIRYVAHFVTCPDADAWRTVSQST